MKLETVQHYAMSIPNWVGHNLHNSWGIINVFDIMWMRPMQGGLLKDDHPFVTGINPETNKPIWFENVVFQSERKREFKQTDEQIVNTLMNYLKGMVAKSASSKKYPLGKADRMPPAVNYIHGCVHYNGVNLIFDDFKDALAHFTDRKFLKEFKRMVKIEKREPTIIFRDKDYDRDEFAIFTCFMKTKFHYFGNPNGNKKRLHWGTPSPIPAFNLITGNWIHDTKALRSEEGRKKVVRPPLNKKDYFQAGPYNLGRTEYLMPEKFWSKWTDYRIALRGDRGGVYFTDKRKLDEGFLYDPKKLITLPERLMEKLSLSNGGLTT